MGRETCKQIRVLKLIERAHALLRGKSALPLAAHFTPEEFELLPPGSAMSYETVGPVWRVLEQSPEYQIYAIQPHPAPPASGSSRRVLAIRCRACGRVSHHPADVFRQFPQGSGCKAYHQDSAWANRQGLAGAPDPGRAQRFFDPGSWPAAGSIEKLLARARQAENVSAFAAGVAAAARTFGPEVVP